MLPQKDDVNEYCVRTGYYFQWQSHHDAVVEEKHRLIEELKAEKTRQRSDLKAVIQTLIQIARASLTGQTNEDQRNTDLALLDAYDAKYK